MQKTGSSEVRRHGKVLSTLNMDSGLMLTVADLHSQAIVDWEQDFHLCFHYNRAAPMKINLSLNLWFRKHYSSMNCIRRLLKALLMEGLGGGVTKLISLLDERESSRLTSAFASVPPLARSKNGRGRQRPRALEAASGCGVERDDDSTK